MLQKRKVTTWMLKTSLAALSMCSSFFAISPLTTYAAGNVVNVYVNRPSSSTIGSVYVWFQAHDGTTTKSPCISLSQQNKDYRAGSGTTTFSVQLQVFTTGGCTGNTKLENWVTYSTPQPKGKAVLTVPDNL
jgi:hypothetical protein